MSENALCSRREILTRCGAGFGMIGLASVLAAEAPPTVSNLNLTKNPLAPKRPHHPAKAKHIIHLYMNGGPSQVDTFDPKPALRRYRGQRPGSIAGYRTENQTVGLRPSPFAFPRCGQSGLEISEIYPHRRQVRRRAVRHPLDAHRHPQSRAVDVHDEQRPSASTAAQLRLLAALRLGVGESEPARLHRSVPRVAGERRRQLEQPIFARRLPGLPHEFAGSATIPRTVLPYLQKPAPERRVASAASSISSSAWTRCKPSAAATTPCSTPASLRWRWRSACKPPPRKRSTSARNQRGRASRYRPGRRQCLRDELPAGAAPDRTRRARGASVHGRRPAVGHALRTTTARIAS